MRDIIIDNNFLPEGAAKAIENEIVYKRPFFFNPGEITDGDFSPLPQRVIGDMFEDHPFFAAGTNSDHESSPIFDIGMYLLSMFCQKNNLEPYDIGRVKSNLTPMSLSKKSAWPHIDSRADHFVFLYYVNDSDGDTVLYENTFNETVYNQEDLIVKQTIKPEAGKAILFNGKFFHGITPPQKTNYRCVVNINLQVREKI